MTAVGYGDLDMKYRSTRVFAIFFILICVCLYAAVVNNLFEIAGEVAAGPPKPYELSDSEWSAVVSQLFSKDPNRTLTKERLVIEIILKKRDVDYNEKIAPIIEVLVSLNSFVSVV